MCQIPTGGAHARNFSQASAARVSSGSAWSARLRIQARASVMAEGWALVRANGSKRTGAGSECAVANQKNREFRGQQELLTQAAQRSDELSLVLDQHGGASYLQVLTSVT